MAFCRSKMVQAERNAERESINKIEAYKKEEKHVWREIMKKRTQMQETGRSVNYDVYEDQLKQRIVTLKGDLMDIEVALQQSLEQAHS